MEVSLLIVTLVAKMGNVHPAARQPMGLAVLPMVARPVDYGLKAIAVQARDSVATLTAIAATVARAEAASMLRVVVVARV